MTSGCAGISSPKVALLLLVIGALDQCAFADTVTPVMRKEDPRLEQRVTINAPRIYVGQLLEKLGAQLKVDVSADERDGAADTVVMAYIRDVPVADALDAVWALLSHRGALYDWRREEINGVYTYRLMRPLAAQRFALTMREEVQRTFEAEAAKKRAALLLPAAELKRLAARDESIAGLIENERQLNGVRAFFESVPVESQGSILRGEKIFPVAVDRLSREAQAFVHKEWVDAKAFKILPDGTRQPLPEPSSINFYVRRSSYPAPSLWIDIEGLGAYNYLGGVPLERAVQTKLTDLWTLPGDRREGPRTQGQIKLSEEDRAHTTDRTRILPKRLRELSDGASVSILARLPRDSSLARDIGSPNGLVLDKYLEQVTQPQSPYLIHKWRNGALLLSHVGWFWESDPAAWRLAKAVFAVAKTEKGPFSLRDLIQIAGRLNGEELRSLAPDFPVLRAVAAWHDLFSRLAKTPKLAEQVLSETGAPIAELSPSLTYIRELSVVLSKPDLEGARVRMRDTEDLGGSVMLQILSSEGKVLGGAGFANRKPVDK